MQAKLLGPDQQVLLPVADACNPSVAKAPGLCFLQCKQAAAAVTASWRTGPATAARWLSPRYSSPACCALGGCTAAGSAQHDILHALLFDRPVYGG